MVINRSKARRFAKELKVMEELRKRLAENDGFIRIEMKLDGQHIDVGECVDSGYLLTFPPYEVHHALHKKFQGLDDVAEFLVNWKGE